MSVEDTAEYILERLDELPRAERVRYLETFLERVKQRVVSRETRDDEVGAAHAEIEWLREALGELAIDHWNSTGYCRRCQGHVRTGHSADCSIVVARKALAPIARRD